MQDRFKFRVFNLETHEYIYNVCGFQVDKSTVFADGSQPIYINHTRSQLPILLNTKNIIIEQCTGIKDKNGVLIYEGDIIKLTKAKNNGFTPKGSKHKIEYLTKKFCGFGYCGDNSLTETTANNCIIIGNIHENPELLGQ